ncbi:hypothetical protein ACQBAU_05690 [Propionibacteriaceae bacterium Y2011]|uniref:hypothetical protein n=1 Tax=Microlunatus sp. Y2014 TaxID=3418488 RepID=UPI003B4802CC
MPQGDFYYCLKHRTVEPYEGCPASDRLGPYPDRQSAEAALTTAAERNEEWDEDPNWNDDEDDDRA